MAMFAVLMWALNYPAIRYVLPYYSPGSIAILRIFISSIFLIVVAAIKKIRLPEKKHLPRIVLCGFIGIFLFNVFLNVGASYVASGVGSFIINSSPVFTLIMSRFILKEVVRPACWFGIIISFCGLMTVMMSQVAGFSINVGVLILLLAAFSTSGYNVILRSLLKTYTAFEATTYAVVSSTVFFLVFIPDAVRDISANPPMIASFFIVQMGIFPAGLAYLAWGFALAKAEKTAHATVFLYLTPFIAAIIGYLWLRESIYLLSMVGGAVIIGGMVLTNTLGKSKNKT